MEKLRKALLGMMLVLAACVTISVPKAMAATITTGNFKILVPTSVTRYTQEDKLLDFKVYYRNVDITDEVEDNLVTMKTDNKSIVSVVSLYKPYISPHDKVGTTKVHMTFKWDASKSTIFRYKVYTEKLNKTISCTVTVKRSPYLRAITSSWSYNSSGKYFSMKIKNISDKAIYVQSRNAKALHSNTDNNYYDFIYSSSRSLKLRNGSSSIKINPGQTKQVQFKVTGSRPNFGLTRTRIYSLWKFNGKTYQTYIGKYGTDCRFSGSLANGTFHSVDLYPKKQYFVE